MQQVAYQTVRLGRGKHVSPEHGACVMELASMLAGEPFSDHPESVSAPIATLLRTYNDMLDDDRRQDLYEFASRTVGTASTKEIEQLRAQRLIAWADEMRGRRPWMIFPRLRRPGRDERLRRDPEAAAREAIHAIGKLSDETHQNVLALLDELIEVGCREARGTGSRSMRTVSMGPPPSAAKPLSRTPSAR